ncbi:hypothetical protein Angca_000265, partial [Angiostrongylus cantonensis]
LVGSWERATIGRTKNEYDRLVNHLFGGATEARNTKDTTVMSPAKVLELTRQCGFTGTKGNFPFIPEHAKKCRQAIKEDFLKKKSSKYHRSCKGLQKNLKSLAE